MCVARNHGIFMPLYHGRCMWQRRRSIVWSSSCNLYAAQLLVIGRRSGNKTRNRTATVAFPAWTGEDISIRAFRYSERET